MRKGMPSQLVPRGTIVVIPKLHSMLLAIVLQTMDRPTSPASRLTMHSVHKSMPHSGQNHVSENSSEAQMSTFALRSAEKKPYKAVHTTDRSGG